MYIKYIIIGLLILIIIAQTILFYYKNRKYLKIKNAEKEVENVLKRAQKEGIKTAQEAQKKSYLILKFRNLISNRYEFMLREYEKELHEKSQKISAKEKEFNNYNSVISSKKYEISKLNNSISKLREEIYKLESDIYYADYGVYKAKYDFVSSNRYKKKIDEVRQEQKKLIKDKNACICNTEWTVGESKREGKKMINRNIKMMLRAFNGESDSIISNVTYKNINTMINRLEKSYEKINELNEVLNMYITDEYYRLKEDELYLVYEYQEKIYLEKEEKRIISQQIKEEERAQKEFERELIRIEKEASRYNKALEEARKELKSANKKRFNDLSKRIVELEMKLAEAEKNKRAISRAQITKSGYIYIISNIGAFGENVYKIGMTRRLEPHDRIRELNGPSVPFLFDVHAMIFSQNAPELELKLHNVLAYAKLNRINRRKEFFRLDLKEIERAVRKNSDSEVEFNYEHEAKEYRLSEKIIEEELRV